VIAPETAAHAAGTSALLPMLALGVPGSPTAAVLLGGLIMWGLQPGPMLFVEQKEFVWGLIASMYLGNVVGLLVVLVAVPWFAAILRVPFSIIAALILVVCAIGAFTVSNAEFDIVLMLAFGVVGYVLKKLDYPLAPLVLALVLGDRTEEAFRQSSSCPRATSASSSRPGSAVPSWPPASRWPLGRCSAGSGRCCGRPPGGNGRSPPDRRPATAGRARRMRSRASRAFACDRLFLQSATGASL
jgi:hypothetical protein